MSMLHRHTVFTAANAPRGDPYWGSLTFFLVYMAGTGRFEHQGFSGTGPLLGIVSRYTPL